MYISAHVQTEDQSLVTAFMKKKTVTSLLRESDNIFYGKIIDLTSFQKNNAFIKMLEKLSIFSCT